MKNWQDLVWKLLFGILIIFFGGWILGGLLNVAAMASPQMVSTVFCPAGSIATRDSDQNGATISCHDPNGAAIQTLTDAESIALQRKYFYLPSTIIMMILVVGWFIRSSIPRMKRNKANL